jgi:broad specificity phosphatase PhoE
MTLRSRAWGLRVHKAAGSPAPVRPRAQLVPGRGPASRSSLRMRCRPVLLLGAGLLASLPAPAAGQASLVVLVRHGEKGDSTADPPLSPRGAARAESLAVTLAEGHLNAIFVTQYRRTRLTAEPTATRFGLTPQVIEAAGDLQAHAAAVARAIEALPRGAAVLVVGHSNTLGPIIHALGGPLLPNLCDGSYATIFLVTIDRGAPPRVVRAEYGAPDPPDPCSRTMR